jgi:hypothetical protein
VSVNTYNAAKHHIGLKQSAGTNFGFTILGQYVKELQREALGGQDFGGATDLIGQAASVSRVTQDDFTGGAFALDWQKDAAMFFDSRGFISQPQSKALAVVPPLVQIKSQHPESLSGGVNDETPHSFFMVAGSIYACFSFGIMRYQIDTATTTYDRLWGLPSGHGSLIYAGTMVSAAYDSNDQKIYALYEPTLTTNLAYVARINTDLTIPSTNPFWLVPTGTESYVAKALEIRDTGLVLALGQHIYSGQPPANPHGPDASVTWTHIGRLPGKFRAAIPFAGLTYILCTDGAFRTSIVAFDGTNLLPIVEFPFAFEGKCLEDYAGRIYVGGTGSDVNGGQHYAELYEVTGSSVRLVRSFAPIANRSGSQSFPKVINDMQVFEGLLWFHQAGTDGRLMAYDITSDGIFGASTYDLPVTAAHDVFKMVCGRGRMWCWVNDSGSSGKDGIFRIAQPADTVNGNGFNAYVETADFTWEPGIKKRWDEFRVLTRNTANSPTAPTTVQASIDGGNSWTTLSTPTTVVDHQLVVASYGLAGLGPSHHIRFKITEHVDWTQGDGHTFREIVAYTFTFIALDTGRRAWSFVICAADEIEARDGTSDTQDVADYADQLWSWARDKTPLLLTDVDRSTAEVQIVGFREVQPIIGPNAPDQSEAHFSINLIEVLPTAGLEL